MALKYGFFNSVNGDRKYDAEDISSIFDGVIGDGVFASVGKIFAVTPGEGLQVLVDTGRAWFDHTWTVNSETVPLNLESPDITLDRYDAVVLEINHNEKVRANSLKIIKGNAESEPTKPSLMKDELVHQYPLAYVLVKHGATSITPSEIEIMVGRGECPFVRGPIETVPIDELFSKWEHEFDVWFKNVQSQLEGDIAANLQRQIDERVKISDKATEDEALLGESDEKWVTPYTAKLLSVFHGFDIGDTKKTANPNPNENWLLCNGMYVDRATYPELSRFFPEDIVANPWTNKQMSMGTGYTSVIGGRDSIFVNGYFIYLGTKAYGGQIVTYISYTKTPGVEGSWKDVTIWSNVCMNYTGGKSIYYINGYYIVCGSYAQSSSSAYGRIAYAKSLDGPWAVKDFFNNSGLSLEEAVVSSITYGNGKFVLCGGTGRGVYVAYCNTIDGNWIQKEIPGTSYTSREAGTNGYGILFDNGQFYIIALRAPNFGEVVGYIVMYNASDPSSSFSERLILGPITVPRVSFLKKVNNYYVIGVRNSNPRELTYLYSTNVNGSFTPSSPITNDGNYSGIIHKVGYDDGMYWMTYTHTKNSIVNSYLRVWRNGKDLSSNEFDDILLNSITLGSTYFPSTESIVVGSLAFSEGIYALAYTNCQPSNNPAYYGLVKYLDTSRFKLPTIASENGLRTFIKAKG